jgi:hypothetical protein
MDEQLAAALDKWCLYALRLELLDELELRLGFIRRDQVARAVAAGAQLTTDEQRALDAADAAWDKAADLVLPAVALDGWLNLQPEDSYVRQYAARHGA